MNEKLLFIVLDYNATASKHHQVLAKRTSQAPGISLAINPIQPVKYDVIITSSATANKFD